MVEAVGLPEDEAEFEAAHPDVPFSYMVVLFQDYYGEPPTAEGATEYWELINEPEHMPVFADSDQGVLEHTPYEGQAIPGKCVLTPELEILHCYTGHGNEQGIAAILEHWEAQSAR